MLTCLESELRKWIAWSATKDRPPHLVANASQPYISGLIRKSCQQAGVLERGLRGLRVTAGARAFRESPDLNVVMARLRLKTQQQATACANVVALLEEKNDGQG